MKSNKEFRGKGNAADSGDSIRRAQKLEPIRKSGKERHALYGKFHEDEEEDDYSDYKRKESVFDYFDDEEESEEETFEEDEEEEEDDSREE